MLCKYKDIFGKPNSGIHRYRLLDIAVVDVLFTFLGAFLISFFIKVNFFLALSILFVLGIFLHRIFCVHTTIDKYLSL